MSQEGAPRHTFVLIPGAGGQASFWDQLRPLLETAGHEVIAVDLPGGDEAAGISEYVDVTIEAIGERNLPIVVAQSMGGFTAVGVCTRIEAALLVFVNAMIPVPGETAGAWWATTGQGDAQRANDIAQGRDPDAEFDVMEMFFHDVPPDVVAQAFAGPEPQETDAAFATPSLFDSWPDVAIKAIIGRDDRLFPAAFQRRVAEERLGITPDEIPGGHLAALSRPQELASRLLSYAAELSIAR